MNADANGKMATPDPPPSSLWDYGRTGIPYRPAGQVGKLISFKKLHVGGNGEVVTPLTIPNREVKHFCADGT